MTIYIFLIFPISLLISVLILYIINNIKHSAYLKGYRQAEFDITASMFDKATWFGGCSITTYNALYLFAAKYRKYKNVDANKFRENILKLNENQRVTDLSKQELEEII